MNGNPSTRDQLRALAQTRLGELERELAKTKERRAQVDREIAALEAEASPLQMLVAPIEAPVGSAEKRPTPDTVDLRETVVELLRHRGPMHYRDVAKELQRAGLFSGGGVDPANTLLAKYFNDPRLYRPRRGVYQIRPEDRPVHNVGEHRNSPSKNHGREGEA